MAISGEGRCPGLGSQTPAGSQTQAASPSSRASLKMQQPGLLPRDLHSVGAGPGHLRFQHIRRGCGGPGPRQPTLGTSPGHPPNAQEQSRWGGSWLGRGRLTVEPGCALVGVGFWGFCLLLLLEP